jgi:hypothetical protein
LISFLRFLKRAFFSSQSYLASSTYYLCMATYSGPGIWPLNSIFSYWNLRKFSVSSKIKFSKYCFFFFNSAIYYCLLILSAYSPSWLIFSNAAFSILAPSAICSIMLALVFEIDSNLDFTSTIFYFKISYFCEVKLARPAITLGQSFVKSLSSIRNWANSVSSTFKQSC